MRSQLRQHLFHRHVIVVSPVGAHFVTSHDGDPMGSGLLVEPNRAFVGDGRVDREPVVAALLKEKARQQFDDFLAGAASLTPITQLDVLGPDVGHSGAWRYLGSFSSAYSISPVWKPIRGNYCRCHHADRGNIFFGNAMGQGYGQRESGTRSYSPVSTCE